MKQYLAVGTLCSVVDSVQQIGRRIADLLPSLVPGGPQSPAVDLQALGFSLADPVEFQTVDLFTQLQAAGEDEQPVLDFFV